MDSDLRNNLTRRFRLWPGLWMPLAILGIGILVSVVLSNTQAQSIADLGRDAYHARHQALVAHIAARLQQTPGRHLPTSLSLSLAADLPEGLHLRIDTLARHTKQAVLELGNVDEPRDSEALRTELTLPGRHWMVTTTPNAGWIDQASSLARWQILAAGTGISSLAAILMLIVCRRLAISGARNQQQKAKLDRDEQQITNLQVEKSVLRHALNDSEARSRDLVRLGGAMIAELDDKGRIGFISAQVADLLGRAPSDLTDRPFEQLVSEQDRSRFRESLDSARHEEDLNRTDLALIGADEVPPGGSMPAPESRQGSGARRYRLSAQCDTPDRCSESERFMSAIAHGGCTSLLAPAKPYPFGFLGGVFDRRDSSAFMGSVAKWLTLTTATGALHVVFAPLNLHRIRAFSGNIRFCF